MVCGWMNGAEFQALNLIYTHTKEAAPRSLMGGRGADTWYFVILRKPNLSDTKNNGGVVTWLGSLTALYGTQYVLGNYKLGI